MRRARARADTQRKSMLPRMLQLKSSPDLLLDEIAVAGLVYHPWDEVADGKPVALLEPDLPLSAHRSSELHSLRSRTIKSLKSAVNTHCHFCSQSIAIAPTKCSQNDSSKKAHRPQCGGTRGNDSHLWNEFHSNLQPGAFIRLIEAMEKEQ